MEHLQIAYDLFVIMIGLAALSIVVFIRNAVPKPMYPSWQFVREGKLPQNL